MVSLDPLSFLLPGIGLVLAIAFLVLLIRGILQVADDRAIAPTAKLLWIVVLLAFPVVGLVVWWTLRDRIHDGLGGPLA